MNSNDDFEINKQNLINLNVELNAKISQAKYSLHKLKISANKSYKDDIDFLSEEIIKLNNKIIENNLKINELSNNIYMHKQKNKVRERIINYKHFKIFHIDITQSVLIKILIGFSSLSIIFAFIFLKIYDVDIIYTDPQINIKREQAQKRLDENDKEREAKSFEFHKANQKLRDLIDSEKKKSDYFHAHDGPLYFKELSSNITKSNDQNQTDKEDNDGPLSTPGVFKITK